MTASPWALLFAAIALEVTATSLLNASQGMTRWGFGAAAILCYSVCFWLLAFTMTRIPVGITYAIWSGVGIVGIAAIGWIVFRQSLTAAQIGFMALIVVGAIGLNVTTRGTGSGTPPGLESPGDPGP